MLNKIEFSFSGGNEGAEFSLTERQIDGIIFADIKMQLKEEAIPEQFSLSWKYSGIDACAIWDPDKRVHTISPDWGMSRRQSRLASWMPIQQTVSFTDKNKILVAVSDVDTPITVNTGYSEETAELSCRIDFFTVPTNAKKSYTATVRIDTRDIPFYDSIYETSAWWEDECGYESAYVPDSARQPMDSLWYSFHQNLEHDKIVRECERSYALGMETVIIDDGWQTDDAGRGYAYCGDWEICEKKMGDMKTLVDKIHNIGMKVILWYSVPFVGMYSKKYEEFKDYLLDDCGNAGTSFALDPRYKKVRDFLVSTYENAVKDWGLDGLKLDFIDNFKLKGKSLEFDKERDYQSLEDGLHALLSEIKSSLTKINPDILIEFRQSYVGPAIKKYGNMLRVGDCPGDIMTNRSQIINLKMTSGKTAVHSDMIMWNEKDSVENAALQFASVIFAVPQISMFIDDLPESHVEMLKHYISFWKENREVLLDGKLTTKDVKSDYSQARATLGGKEIIAVYSNPFVKLNEDKNIVVNASGMTSVVIKSDKEKSYKVVDCMGKIVSEGTICKGITEVSIPKAGMIII